jgi:hypothetical protein
VRVDGLCDVRAEYAVRKFVCGCVWVRSLALLGPSVLLSGLPFLHSLTFLPLQTVCLSSHTSLTFLPPSPSLSFLLSPV